MGLKAEGTSGDYDALDPESYKEVAHKATAQYPNVTHVGTTLRVAKTGLLNDWRTLLYDGSEFYFSRIYENLEIVDRVGGGDNFSAGIIAGMLAGKPARDIVDFAGAYSALAHTFPGDVNWATRAEAETRHEGRERTDQTLNRTHRRKNKLEDSRWNGFNYRFYDLPDGPDYCQCTGYQKWRKKR